MSMNPNGRSKARLFRKYRKIEGRCCDLEAIAEQDHIEILDAESSEPGWTACLVAFGGTGLISCQPGQNRGRRRFSIAHELAHFHLPTHRTKTSIRKCVEEDLEAAEGYRAKEEWEANSFAAYLLMPGKYFRRDARDCAISFSSARDLAGIYDVSVTAAARRLVEVTSEHCALVATEDRCVRWQERNEYYWRMPTKGQRIRPETFAAGVYDGEGANLEAREVQPYAWINNAVSDDLVLLESTLHVSRSNQVLSLLWAPEYEEGYW